MCWCINVYVLMCWCVDVLICWWVDELMSWWLCWCVDVLMTLCWCVDVLMCSCVDVLMTVLMDVLMAVLMCWWVCWCVDVLMCWCVDVLMCWCVDVLMCWCVSSPISQKSFTTHDLSSWKRIFQQKLSNLFVNFVIRATFPVCVCAHRKCCCLLCPRAVFKLISPTFWAQSCIRQKYVSSSNTRLENSICSLYIHDMHPHAS